MPSVTQRIKEIKQPHGGYLKPSDFEEIQLNDDNKLGEENISSGLVGLVVDYMTRYVMGAPLKKAFEISLMGANVINDTNNAMKLLNNIDGLNSKSIINACKLVGYDVCYRAGVMGYEPVDEIQADDNTIQNIIIMINRSVKFFDNYGPIVTDGFTFEGGYTNTINAGDGDFLTKNTLWDFKVSSKKPTSAHTLQLLIYYIMGKHSIHSEFDNIEKLGIFNPRLNCVYLKEIKDIPLEIIEEVSDNVIGYNNESNNSIKNYSNDSKNEFLTIEDLMNELNCSRYKIMKLYLDEGLPLQKIKNKYYINKENLYYWLEEKAKEARVRKIIALVIVLIGILITIILFNSIHR